MLNNAPLVAGTTGHTAAQLEQLEHFKQILPVIHKQNFSAGANALMQAVKEVKLLLPDFDCEIVEIHRRGKKDAPSGTALQLAASLTDVPLRKNGKPFSSTTIHSLRMGGVFGTHTVIFAGHGETLTFTHSAESVEIFALGAVLAAEEVLQN